MVEKKLITLACAIGILACGACFLPPPTYHPPRLRLGLRGVQSIRVEAANVSESHHLDPASLAWGIASCINVQTRNTGVSGTAQKEAGFEDAVLQITVLNESATPSPSSDKRLSVLVRISATLTNQNGQMVWRETDAAYPVSYHFTSKDSADAWKEPNWQRWVASTVGSRLVSRMFYGH